MAYPAGTGAEDSGANNARSHHMSVSDLRRMSPQAYVARNASEGIGAALVAVPPLALYFGITGAVQQASAGTRRSQYVRRAALTTLPTCSSPPRRQRLPA
jgi:hypothetical protein